MPKTLLLADDSVTIQKVVGISLANEDIELVTVDNGDDAVTRAQELRPDIVLADIVMPGKNGYEVCEALKSDPSLAQTPVLLLTGTFEAFDAERARQAQADGHITKPFEAQALVDQVNQLLARSTPLGDDAGTKIDTPTAATAAATGAGAPKRDESFDFFGGASASAGAASDADLMSDSQPNLSPGNADETVLIDASRTTEDPAFDAAVEAAAFDAPSVRAPDAFSDPGDSGFDIENADLSMASTVPEAAPPTPDLTFSEPAPSPLAPKSPPTVTDLDAVAAPMTEASGAPVAPEAIPSSEDEPAVAGADEPAVAETDESTVAEADESTVAEADESTVAEADEPAIVSEAVQDDDATESLAVASPPEPDATDPLVSFDLAGPAAASANVQSFDVTPDALADTAAADAPDGERDIATDAVGGIALDGGAANEGIAVESDVQSFDVEPTAATPEPDTTVLVEDADPARVQSPADVETGVTASEAPSTTDLPPAFQQHIHATLEKVAWEAFSDLSEQVVKQALARVEAIAWEVIPQMAETLVREEIARMKEDGNDD